MVMRRYIATNQEALRQLRLGLGFLCVIPPKSFVNGFPSELASFKHLSQLLLAEGELAMSEGRTRFVKCSYFESSFVWLPKSDRPPPCQAGMITIVFVRFPRP